MPADRGDDAVALLLPLLFKEKPHGVVQSDLVSFRTVAHDRRKAKHPFQIGDPRLVLIHFPLCRVILEVLREIPVRTGLPHRLDELWPEGKLPLLDLLPDSLHIRFCQLLSHGCLLLFTSGSSESQSLPFPTFPRSGSGIPAHTFSVSLFPLSPQAPSRPKSSRRFRRASPRACTRPPASRPLR